MIQYIDWMKYNTYHIRLVKIRHKIFIIMFIISDTIKIFIRLYLLNIKKKTKNFMLAKMKFN